MVWTGVDLLREALRVLVDCIMDPRFRPDGAQHGERSPERVTYRNGYRNRTWDTRVGTLHIPKLREGSYFPSFWNRGGAARKPCWPSSSKPMDVSTRRVDDLIRPWVARHLQQPGGICEPELDEVVESFLGRPLDEVQYPYVWLDGLTQKVREGGRIVNVCVVGGRGQCSKGTYTWVWTWAPARTAPSGWPSCGRDDSGPQRGGA